MISSLNANDLVWRFGWMLFHSLWQMALIGLVLLLFLQITRKRSARLRYGIACCGLMVCYLPLVCTFLQPVPGTEESLADTTWLSSTAQLERFNPDDPDHAKIFAKGDIPDGYFYLSENDPADPDAGGPITFDLIEEKSLSAQEDSLIEQIQALINPWISWLVGLWIAGVCLFAIWNAGGWVLVQRLRRQGTPLSSSTIRQRAYVLLVRMQICRTVKFLESMLVDVPVVIGWVKPVVLLPAGLLTRLTPEQVEAVIAHELAHIRRHDYLINLLQTLTESLLFYHPVVWWISHRIRVEREYCCDDVAVAFSGDRRTYVRTLAAIETIRAVPAHAVSFAGRDDASTLSRMRRLLIGSTPSGGQGWLAGLSTVALVCCLGLTVAFSQPQKPEPETITTGEQGGSESETPPATPAPQADQSVSQGSVPFSRPFQLDLTSYGESVKPQYKYALRNNLRESERHGVQLGESADFWEDLDQLSMRSVDWLNRSGFFRHAREIDGHLPVPSERTSPGFLMRVTIGNRTWEEDLGFDLGALLRLESLQNALTSVQLKTVRDPDAPFALEPLLSRLSGYKKIWMEGQPVSDLKLKVSSEQIQSVSGTPIPIKLEITNSGNQPQPYEQHILSLVPSAIRVLDEYGRRVPYVGGTSQLPAHQVTLSPGEAVVLDQFDLAQFHYLRPPGQYLMYATHGNGVRSNSFRFEVTRSEKPKPDFVGPLLPLVHDDWILVANPNFEGEIHPGKNFSKVAGFPVRFQYSRGSIRDLSHVWLYLTKTRAEPLETPIEQYFLPETSYLGQIGDHHLYAHVDEKSQQRWPDVLDQIRAALQKHTDEEEYSEVQPDLERLIRQEREAMEKIQPDPITRLIAQLVDAHGLWLNGVYPDLKLPASSTPKEILAEAIKWHGFDKGHIQKHKVLEVRKGIQIDAGVPLPEFSAVRIESDQGNKILLMYLQPETKIWWTRFYDAPEVAAEALEWGKADNGIQVSLSSTKAEWAQKETPTLKLTVRNTSEKSVSFIPHIGVCRVEYDGTWYVWGSPVAWGGRAVVVEPGQTADSEVPLRLFHDDPQGWISEKNQMPLELEEGQHTIRVGLKCNEGASPASQPLELKFTEVIPSDENR